MDYNSLVKLIELEPKHPIATY